MDDIKLGDLVYILIERDFPGWGGFYVVEDINRRTGERHPDRFFINQLICGEWWESIDCRRMRWSLRKLKVERKKNQQVIGVTR
jgi:hypothetical protein